MLPGEMVILMAIAGTSDSGKKLLMRPMDITSEYIGYLYYSLVRRGYIKGNGPTGYQLSPKGKESLFEFLHGNKTKARETIKTLQLLGIEINQELDKLEKEVIKVN